MLKTMGFPGRYVQGEGALSSLGQILREMGLTRPLAIIDPVVGKDLWPKVAASLSGQELPTAMLEFPGECTRKVIAQLGSEAERCRPDVIIALGGGKTIDTAKGVARALRLSVVVCPTIASSDAPTSRLIVLYDSLHKVVGVDYMDRNPDAVVRELKNMVHRAFILADQDVDLAAAIGAAKPVVSGVESDCVTFPLGSRLADAEQRLIFATLGYCGGNKTQTAEVLGVSLKTLYNRLNEYQSKIFTNEPAMQTKTLGANVNSGA